MLLRNFYKCLAGLFAGDKTGPACYRIDDTDNTVSPTIYGTSTSNKTSDAYGIGALSFIQPSSSYTRIASLNNVMTSNGAFNGGTVFGDGTDEVTFDDLTMSGNIITGITATCTATATHDDDGVTIEASYTITNNNSNDITISEIGRITYLMLIERTLLDTPVTIPGGAIGQVKYRTRFDFPTFTR